MKLTTSASAGRAPTRGRLEDLIGPAEFPVLRLQLANPVALRGGDTGPLVLVDLGPPQPLTQLLRPDA
jgi:hypothetical protein